MPIINGRTIEIESCQGSASPKGSCKHGRSLSDYCAPCSIENSKDRSTKFVGRDWRTHADDFYAFSGPGR